MATVQELETQLDQLKKRREELAAEQEEARSILTTKRQALVSGSAKVAEVTNAQLTLTTLVEALSDIDGQLTVLRRELSKEQAVAARAATIEELARLANEGNTALAEAEAIRAEAATLLERLVSGWQAAEARQIEARRRFRQLVKPLVPDRALNAYPQPGDDREQQLRAVREVLSEVRAAGGDPSGVLANLEGSVGTSVDRPYNYPTNPFAETLDLTRRERANNQRWRKAG